MPSLTETTYSGTDEQRAYLVDAYRKLQALPASQRWLNGNWMARDGRFYHAGADIPVEKILDPECGFCTGGMLAKVGLEQINAPPPADIQFLAFLGSHFGLTEDNVGLITYWNDSPNRAVLSQSQENDALDARTGGLRAVGVILGLETARVTT